MRKLKILFVSAEIAPFSKTGGLADVSNALPLYLKKAGHDIRTVMPCYADIPQKLQYETDFAVQMGDNKETCILRRAEMEGTLGATRVSVPAYFIDSYKYYDRKGIYCFHDDGERYIFLCKAVAEMIKHIDFLPDIIHLNDWHTGPIALLVSEYGKTMPMYADIKTVFTIHNLEFQGVFPRELIYMLNIGDEFFTPDGAEFYGGFNFAKAGIVYSDKVNAVSRNYAEEIQTPVYGEKLDGLLKYRSKDLRGIINGISYNDYNPAADADIYAQYSSSDIDIKAFNKKMLQLETGLEVKADIPLFGIVHRLTEQKGFILMMDRINSIMKHDFQLVVLGTGDPYYEDFFKKLACEYPGRVSASIAFNNTLAHRIYAGSDLFLMPSRFEPCGLGQLISLRYGTLPLVRATGGLADTVTDYDENNGNGFVFKDFNSNEFEDTFIRAINAYSKNKKKWKETVKRAMNENYSFENPSKEYEKMYYDAVGIQDK